MLKKRLFRVGIGNIILLGIVSLLNDFSSEMILPILPLFIASLGGTGLAIGLISGFIEGVPNLLKVFTGYYSDKIRKRKKFIFWGYFSSQFFKLMLIFATGWKAVFALTSADKIGKGIRETPRDALIAESLPKKTGKGFGIQRALDTTGAILGSLAILFIVLAFGEVINFKGIIFIAAIIGFSSLIPLAFVREVRKNKIHKPEKINFRSASKSISLKLWTFIIISGIFALANFSYMFFILKAHNVFLNFKNTLALTLSLYVLFNIFYASLAIPFGNLSDKHGRRKFILMGYFLFALTCLGMIFFNNFVFYSLLFAIYGISNALIVGNQRAFVADFSNEKYKATSIGIFNAVLGIAAIVGGIIAGFLWQINSNYTFIYGAVLAGISIFLMALHRFIFRIKK